MFSPDSTVLRWFLLPYALIGLVVCSMAGPESRRWVGLVMAATLIGAVSVTAFFGYVRQGLLMMPWLLSFAGVTTTVLLGRGLSWMQTQAAPDRRLLWGLAALVLIFGLVEYQGVDDRRNFEATGDTIPGSHKLNRDQPIQLKLLPPE